LSIVTSVFLTALVIGGGIYWWTSQKQAELNTVIASLRTQIDQLKGAPTAAPTSTISNNQSDELVKTKFELAILNFWQVRSVFRDPQNKNKFYYVSEDSSGASIWVYDLVKDKTYQQKGTFNIPEGNTMLLNQKLAQYQEFRGVGFSGNKFVFVETINDNSPGPCFSPWFYSNLEYIDLGVFKPTRKLFILPNDLKSSEEQKASECQNTL